MKVMPNNGWKRVKFVAKNLSPTMADFELELLLNRTYPSIFVHSVTYRQFSSNEYRKFLLDVWEDMCEVSEKAVGNVFLKVIERILSGNTNMFRKCPFVPGKYFIRMRRMPMDKLNFGQILPSGRYRCDLTLADGYQGNSLIMFKVYLSISDRRTEQF